MLTYFSFRTHRHSVPPPPEIWDDDRLQRESEQISRPIQRPAAVTFQAFLDDLIAAHDGIRPDEVTPMYIHKQREKRLYPTTRYELGSSYGGYNTQGLRFLTLREFNEIEERVWSELAKL